MSNGSPVTISAQRTPTERAHEGASARVDAAHAERERYKEVVRGERIRRAVWHGVIFLITFIFTTGVLALGVLLWVRPEALFALVVVGLLTSLVFVATFATLRIIILQRLYPGPAFLEEEGRSAGYHIGTGVAYGTIALVVALFLAGLLINIATAFTV